MDRNKILAVAAEILEAGNVVGAHGTSISNAKSIMRTGLNGNKTTFVTFEPNCDPKSLAAYGWKENREGDAANVVIEIPSSFYRSLLNQDEKANLDWRAGLIGHESALIGSVSDVRVSPTEPGAVRRSPFATPTTGYQLTVPKEFIRGMFVYNNGKNYLSFDRDRGDWKDEAVNHLDYTENTLFFDNLPAEKRTEFVEKMKTQMVFNKSTPQPAKNNVRTAVSQRQSNTQGR